VVSLSLHIYGVDLLSDTLNPHRPALYISLLNNISVSISLYCLYVFYIVVKDDLARFKPWNMFLCIKAVIFFSYWQGVGLFFLQHAEVIKPGSTWTAAQTALAIQVPSDAPHCH
jgi:hypothetical protein